MPLSRITPRPPAAPARGPLRATRPLSRAECMLCAALALAALLALALPATPLPALYDGFADQRGWGHLPHAADVLSNLPFALAAAWLWGLQRRWQRATACGMEIHAPSIHDSRLFNHCENTHTACSLVRLAAIGLLATAVGSSIYHWAPGDAGLAIDRLGMALAFAGVLGLAVAERVSARAGRALAGPLLLATMAAALWAWRMDDMTPWATVQGTGLLLLLALCARRPLPGSPGVHWTWVVLAYALAKGLEVADHAVFGFTQGWVSGHSLKHLAAALAVLPIGLAMRRHLRQGL